MDMEERFLFDDTLDFPIHDLLNQQEEQCDPEIDSSSPRSFDTLIFEGEPAAHKRKRDACDAPAEEPCASRPRSQSFGSHDAMPQSDSYTAPVPEVPEATTEPPSLSCDVTQGYTDRQTANQGGHDAWLRSMNRLTYMKGVLSLNNHTHMAQQIARALASVDDSNPVRASLHMRLLYADNSEPVELKRDGSCRERITVISRQGNTKTGFVECDHNSIHFANSWHGPALPVHEYLEVKFTQAQELQFQLKFSTNVTSRRHGMRNNGRQFSWDLVLQLDGITEQPLILQTRSHSFGYISRPNSQSCNQPICETQSTSEARSTSFKLSLVEVASDNRPGDIVTCLGENLHHDHICAQLGQNNNVVADLARIRPSERAFITRLPYVAPGNYWLRMCSPQEQFEASEQFVVQIIHAN